MEQYPETPLMIVLPNGEELTVTDTASVDDELARQYADELYQIEWID